MPTKQECGDRPKLKATLAVILLSSMNRSGLGFKPISEEEINEKKKAQKQAELDARRKEREGKEDEVSTTSLSLLLSSARALPGFLISSFLEIRRY